MDNFKEIIDDLILQGAIQICGVDEKSGEFLYQFTPKLKDIMPELYKEHLNSVNSELMNLWEKGFVNMDLMSESPIVTLAHKAFEKNEISVLSKEEQHSLNEIKRILLYTEL